MKRATFTTNQLHPKSTLNGIFLGWGLILLSALGLVVTIESVRAESLLTTNAQPVQMQPSL